MVKAGIVGSTGYASVELLRMLVQHREVELAAITARNEAGTAVATMFPSLRGRVDLALSDPAAAPGALHLVVVSLIDNLMTGASGQAVQSMNVMFGLRETLGLDQVPVVP